LHILSLDLPITVALVFVPAILIYLKSLFLSNAVFFISFFLDEQLHKKIDLACFELKVLDCSFKSYYCVPEYWEFLSWNNI